MEKIVTTPAEELTTRQRLAIVALLECDTRDASAKAAGVSVRSLQRWLLLPAFAAELGRQRSRMLDATATVLVKGSVAAAQALVAMAAGTAKASTPRVQAARAVCDLSVRLEERGELVAMVRKLEADAQGTAAKSAVRRLPWQ